MAEISNVKQLMSAFDAGVLTMDELKIKCGGEQPFLDLWRKLNAYAIKNSHDAIAQCVIGMNYYYYPVNNSEVLAFKQFELAANQGNANGMYWLAKSYQAGNGVPQNVEMAIRLIQQSAKMGHAGAQYQLGLLYLDKAIPSSNPGFDARPLFDEAKGKGHTAAALKIKELNEFWSGGIRKKRRTIRKYNKKRTLRKRQNKRRV